METKKINVYLTGFVITTPKPEFYLITYEDKKIYNKIMEKLKNDR